jgi:hypothetical protein
MPAEPGHDTWKRLGRLLERRRVEMEPRYMNRALFAAERGVDYRLTYDIESAARTNFRSSTRRAIEMAYGVRIGGIDDVLAGAAELPVQERPVPRGLTPEERRIADGFAELVSRSREEALRRSGGGGRA